MGILHFPGVLPLRSMAERFVSIQFSMVVCEGWVLFFPLLWTQLLGVLILFCHRQNIFLCSCPHPRQADCGCRPGFPLGSHFHLVEVGFLVLRIYLPRISFFPDSGPLLHEGHLQALLFCFSLSGSTGIFIRMPWIPFLD